VPRTLRTSRGTTVAVAFAAVAAIVVGALIATRPGDGDAAPSSDQPNIIVIMTDDQTIESMRVMPKVDELIAAQGVTFSDSIVSFPLCCPSRATFLTGQYSHNHGVRGNQLPNGGYESFDGQDTTLPVALQRAGYDTVHIGKYLNGYGFDSPVDAPPGWSEWHTLLDPRAQRYFGFTLLENGVERKYGQDDYSTDVFTDLATESIRSRAAADAPLFLTVSYFAPHSDFSLEDEGLDAATPAPRHRGTFDGEPIPGPASFDEADASDKPQSIQDLPRITEAVRTQITSNYARYLESLLAVDEGVEAIVTALEEAGQLEDTVIVFTSDNGYFFGEHRVPAGKVRFYEPSIRVPLLIRGPGISAGATRRSLVANIDLAPTILDLAGATSLRTMDGRSLVPLLEGEPEPEDRAILLESTMGGPNDLTPNYGVRTARYAYFEQSTGEKELYDLSTDPDQLDNRHGDPELVAVETRLAEQVATLRECAGTACR